MDNSTPETQAFPQGKPVDDESVQGTSVRDNPVGDKPVHGTPVRDHPVQGTPVRDHPVQGTPVGDKPVHVNPAQGNVSTPSRPKGPNASAIVLGLVALVFGGLLIASETAELTIDWSGNGPLAIIGIGVLLVVLGGIGLVRRHDDT